MKHDRCTRVATRQNHHRLRDVFVATLGAGILAFQITAVSASLGAGSNNAVAGAMAPVEAVAEGDVCARPGAAGQPMDEQRGSAGDAADDPRDQCS